jgi:hypothetical protein
MDTVLLKVPYVSQKALGADQHNNDCGAACMSMMLKAFNLAKDLTVDELFDLIEPTGNIGLGAPSMAAKMKDLGLNTSWMYFPALGDLFEKLQEGKPVIALIHYAPLVKNGFTEFKNFLGAHFVVIVGMDIARVYFQDPDRDDGVNLTAVPINVFLEAWKQCPLDDGNPPFMGIVTNDPIMNLSPHGRRSAGAGTYTMNANVTGANVHAAPNQGSDLVPPYQIWQCSGPDKEEVKITKVQNGYGHLEQGGWVSMDLFTLKES